MIRKRILIALSATTVVAAVLSAAVARAEQDAVIVTNAEVAACYATWARRMNFTASQLDEALTHSGKDIDALKNRVRDDIARCKASRVDNCKC
jgi:hypothetical protein